MDDLLRRRAIDMEKAYKKKRKRKEKEDVVYGPDGKALKGKIGKTRRTVLVIVILLGVIVIAVYAPVLFTDNKKNSSGKFPITPDPSAIRQYQSYLKDHPDADFDNDGLDNALENEHGTDVWMIDSDKDGVSDYAELYIFGTSPTSFGDGLLKYTQSRDKETGQTLDAPYKVDDVILWPSTYTAKAYGAVVRTFGGYRFTNYKGWVRFPGGGYAYGYKDGIHYELEHKEKEDAYWIDTSDEISVVDVPLTFVYRVETPFGNICMDDGLLGSVLDILLPSEGSFVNCRRMATIDSGDVGGIEKKNDIRSPFINKTDYSRLSMNMNSLDDLAWIRKVIDGGDCVAVSLYSANVGESIGIIYGYSMDGSLLVADESLEPAGSIHICESAARIMTEEGQTGQVSWFEWNGMGFDSRLYGDRICFFASTVTGVGMNPEHERETENEDSGTEAVTENHTGESEEPTENHTEESELPVGKQIENTEVPTEKQTELSEPASEPATEQSTESQMETMIESETPETVITFGF